jgi:ketosteroid isomerase-like protein
VNASPAPETDLRVTRLQQFFETLTPATIATLDRMYTDDVYFKDPFNEVRGRPALRRILEHMFEQVDMPRFVVSTAVAQGAEAFLTWEFLFRTKRRDKAEQVIRGASHIKFAQDGRASYHRDYWDAAEELYEKMPVLGGLMRLLRRQAAA